MWTFPRTSLVIVHNKPSHQEYNLGNFTFSLNLKFQNQLHMSKIFIYCHRYCRIQIKHQEKCCVGKS